MGWQKPRQPAGRASSFSQYALCEIWLFGVKEQQYHSYFGGITYEEVLLFFSTYIPCVINSWM